MDSQYLKWQRDMLRKRYERLAKSDPVQVHAALLQFWNYLHAQPLLTGILAKLKAEAPSYSDELKALVENQLPPKFAHEADVSNFALRVIEHCASVPVGGYGEVQPEVELSIRHGQGKMGPALDWFRANFLQPLCDVVDESLDQQRVVLSVLIRYKKKVEWFEREQVLALSAKGERTLVSHLYSYLHDQGMDFHIEPQSVSGISDLVSPDLVLDAKIFDGADRGRPYVKHGLHQLLTYARDFNQGVGYLVIYRTCATDLQFSFAEESMAVPFIVLGGKTLYLLVVDVCPNLPSASKRGNLKAHVLSRDDLLEVLSDDYAARPTKPGTATEATSDVSQTLPTSVDAK